MSVEPVVIMVAGKPVPQLRARARGFVQDGKARARVYDPAVSREWKRAAAHEAMVAMQGRTPMLGPVSLTLMFRIAPPRSWPKWKIAAALGHQIEPTGKPDLDNLEKAAKDALNGIVWQDDAQVVQASKAKEYHQKPAVWIKVEARTTLPHTISRKADLEPAP